MVLDDVDIRKKKGQRFTLRPSEAIFLGLLHRSRPVIYKELLIKENELFRDYFVKYAAKPSFKRWADTDGYVKRLFANLALYEYEDPRSITLRLNEKLVESFKSPDAGQRKRTVNYVRDQITRKMRELGEQPRFWFVVEPVPAPHLHGGFVLSHTDPELFRSKLKGMKNYPNNALETPLQANATGKYGVDSRHQWVTYTSKSSRAEGFDYAISRDLNCEARRLYETLLSNRKMIVGKKP